MAPSSQLVWLLVKNNNCFLYKGLHGVQLSAEPNNLYNVNSYKYSGLANEKVYGVSAGEDGAVIATRSRANHHNKPAKAQHSVVSKKNFRRVTSSISKEVQRVRPDLKAAALARASAVNKTYRTANGKKAAK